MKHVLLIQTAFLGDVILTTPMISAFKKNFPDTKLTLLVTPAAAAIIRTNPQVDDILEIDKKGDHRGILGMLKILTKIRKRKFDTLLSPHQSHRTGVLSWLSGIPRRIGYETAGFSRLAYTQRLKRPMEKNEIQRLLQFLFDSLKIENRNFSEDVTLFEDENSIQQAVKIIEGTGKAPKPILLAASSVWPTKRWEAEGFAKLAEKLIQKFNSPVLLIGSKDDFPVSEQVIQIMQRTCSPNTMDLMQNLCGKTSLLGLYSLMKRSRMLISNDSAPVHIACAAQIPVVAIFGPTTVALGYAPSTPLSAIAELSDLPCRPCGTHGGKKCPLGHFDCMKKLTPEMVFEKIDELLEKTKTQ